MKASDISRYAIIHHEKGFMIFGGYSSKNPWSHKIVGTIALFDENSKKWSKLGELATPRNMHGVIYHVGSFFVIGGRGRH